MKKFWIVKGLKIAVFATLGIAALATVVMLLWNALMPAIFGLGTITWLQALGLFALSKLLFGGNWKGRGGHRCGRGPGSHEWKHKFRQKWANMSEEDKAKMRAHWGKGCHSKGNPWMEEEKGAEA
jgi:hypothetical protein